MALGFFSPFPSGLAGTGTGGGVVRSAFMRHLITEEALKKAERVSPPPPDVRKQAARRPRRISMVPDHVDGMDEIRKGLFSSVRSLVEQSNSPAARFQGRMSARPSLDDIQIRKKAARSILDDEEDELIGFIKRKVAA